jgi:hypothetical protein
MGRSGVRVCRNVVVGMTQSFWVECYQESSGHSQCQSSTLILRVEVRVEIDLVRLRSDSQRICRSVLVQSCKVNQTQSCLLKRKLVVKAIETILRRVINSESSPQPSDNTGTHKRLRTRLTSNYCSAPKRHLTPWLYVSNKGSLDHYLQNNYSNKPHKFTRACVASVVQSTKLVHVYNNEKKRCSISMLMAQEPSIRHITHQMLYTVKCLINMCCIVHCQKNTSQNLQYQTQSSLNSPIVISVQIRRSRITNQMILDYRQYGLVKNATALLFHISSHLKIK